MADEVKPIYVGTRLKYTVDIQSEGFSMTTDDFEVTIKTTRYQKTITKAEMKITAGEEYLFTIDTKEFGTGEYWAYTTAFVPDEDFDDGFRKEVTKTLLCVITS